jgi:hypothetical protein
VNDASYALGCRPPNIVARAAVARRITGPRTDRTGQRNYHFQLASPAQLFDQIRTGRVFPRPNGDRKMRARPILFVVCFTLGVTLMVFSGYLPQAASARGGSPDRSALAGASGSGNPSFPPTVTRAVQVQSPENPPATDAAFQVAPPPAVESAVAAKAAQEPEPGSPEPSSDQTPPPAESAAALSPNEATAPAEVVGVFADAGPDRVVWIGWDELTLDGSGSSGQDLTYRWQQLRGPRTLAIRSETQATTVASGVLDEAPLRWRNAVYEFELTVTDASGAQNADRVKYTVSSAPPLKIKPTPERRFELRNGYQLAHFVSWITNLESYEALFEIASPTELTFTKVVGDACEVTGGKGDTSYLYQIVVYGQAGMPSSWVEFLVDTEDKIPAIVQLGVNWETR